jgi:hypothetical protein
MEILIDLLHRDAVAAVKGAVVEILRILLDEDAPLGSVDGSLLQLSTMAPLARSLMMEDLLSMSCDHFMERFVLLLRSPDDVVILESKLHVLEVLTFCIGQHGYRCSTSC